MSNGIQVAQGQVTEYYQEVKMPIIAGYDVARLYFDTVEMKHQVGCQRMERVLTPNLKVMSKSEIDYVELVGKLNTELFERFSETEKGFEYSTTGFVDVISFDGVLLWNSEIEGREWIEEKNDYEPFEPFIRRIFNEYLDKMHALKI